MGATDWTTSHPLVRSILREGPHFSFAQAVRLIQRLHPEAAPVGHQGPPSAEVLRFTSNLSLNFHTSDIASVGREQVTDAETGEQRTRYRMACTFLGLYGAGSPIPSSYTEDLLHQDPDSVERGFYDLFQHRLLSLFARVFERYRYAASFRFDGEDALSRQLSRFLHVDPELLPDDHQNGRLPLVALAGLLTQQPSSAATLEAAIRARFPDNDVELQSFIGRWLAIPNDQRVQLGVCNTTLGEDAHLGDTIFDRSSTFRVAIEASTFDEYVRFLPWSGGDLLGKLRELIDLFNSDFLDYQLEVRLSQREQRATSPLGAPTSLLGWSTWLGAPAPTERFVRIIFRGAHHGRR